MTQKAEIAVSISDAPDRAKLGFSKREENRVLFTVCAHLIRAGYSILYSGDLRPGGYTLALFEFISGTYAGQGIEPFTNLLPEPVVARMGYDALMDTVRAAQGTAHVELAVDGTAHPVRRSARGLLVGAKGGSRVEIGDDASLAAWLAGFPVVERARGFTAARELSAERVAARVSLGGKMGLLGNAEDQYEGAMPGIAEEAILTLERRGVYVPLAAFGGATRDVAIALGLLPEDQRVPRGDQADSYHPAMSRIAGMCDLIDAGTRGALAALVASDRAEEIGAGLVRLLQSGSNASTPARPQPSSSGN
jgi:hypothetical protein